MEDKYKNSRRFSIALYAIVSAFDAWAFYEIKGEAIPLLAATLPTMLLHAMAYSHTTNKVS